MIEQQNENRPQGVSRRALLRDGTLWLAGSLLFGGEAMAWAATDEGAKPKIRLGLVTDLHYADKPARDTRYYRESPAKLAEAAKRFERDKPDLVIHLGDLIDAAPSLELEKAYLRRIFQDLAAIAGKHHCVVGNHCVENLTKPEFLEIVGQERSYYSFDAGGLHFVVLDACFRSDGQPYGRKNFHWGDAKIPAAELQWLQADLRQTARKSIVFVHQCLDQAAPFGVKNAPEVRKILEASGKVLAVMQGHYHWGNYQEIGGLHYCTCSAVIEGSGAANNAYAVMDVLPGDVIRITGFRKEKSYRWS